MSSEISRVVYNHISPKFLNETLPQTVYCAITVYTELQIISIFPGCMVWIEKSVTRVTDRHYEACRVMPNSDPE